MKGEFEKYKDIEEKAWAMIWKVTEELQGHIPTGEEAQEIIDEIINLQKSGKITKLQQVVLNRMGMNRALDSFDEF